METYKNLYPHVCAFENLYRAYRAARKAKRGREGAAAFERDQERELLQLQAELLTETYTPGPYHSFYTSQFWANVYLNSFDHFVTRASPGTGAGKRELKCPAYLRYVDDFILFGDDKAQLHEWRAAITTKLAELRLSLHANRAQAFPVDGGIPFLGFRVYPTHRRLKRRKGVAFQRRFKRLTEQLGRGVIDLEQVHASVRGWVNHVCYGNTYGLRRAILGQRTLFAPLRNPASCEAPPKRSGVGRRSRVSVVIER